jgi:hypothetical protein
MSLTPFITFIQAAKLTISRFLVELLNSNPQFDPISPKVSEK